jgi:hypothetical protein
MQYYSRSRESKTVARCATLGRSQDVCKESRLSIEGKRCAVCSWSLLERLEVNQGKKKLLRLPRLPRILERLHTLKVNNKLTILWGGVTLKQIKNYILWNKLGAKAMRRSSSAISASSSACMRWEFRVQGSGCRVQGSGFRVQGLGFRV